MHKYSRACITDNMYCLLQYLLISTEEQISQTYFFFDKDVRKEISHHYNHVYVTAPNNKIVYALKKTAILYLKYIIWPFLFKCELFGQDNNPFSSPIIGGRKITLIEDGVMNYTCKPKRRSMPFLRKLFCGTIESQLTLGYNDCVSRILLTGLLPVPKELKHKVEMIDLESLWNNSSETKKSLIMQNFNITKKDIMTLSDCSSILFTQPLSEDGLMTEVEKISIYSKIVKDAGPLIIKSHPREKTNYSSLFPDCTVFYKPVPFELLSLLNIKFKDVYTVFSTAALTLPYQTNIHFLGTKIHPNLLKIYGNVSYEK